MPFASKTNTQMLSKRSKPTFLYAFRGSKGCLQEGTDRKKNERRKRDRDRVCCLYRNRLGGAKARLRAAEFDGVGRGGEPTATQTGSGGSLGNLGWRVRPLLVTKHQISRSGYFVAMSTPRIRRAFHVLVVICDPVVRFRLAAG